MGLRLSGDSVELVCITAGSVNVDLPATSSEQEVGEIISLALGVVKLGLLSGLHRLHARNPLFEASVGLRKNTMLARRARREGQVGRQ